MGTLEPSLTVEPTALTSEPQPRTESKTQQPGPEIPPQNDDVMEEEEATKPKQQEGEGGEQQDAFVSASESPSESEPSTTSNNKSPKTEPENEEEEEEEDDDDEIEEEDRARKKQKPLSSFNGPETADVAQPEIKVESNGIVSAGEENNSNGNENNNAETLKPAPVSVAKKKKSASKKKKNNNNMWVTKSTRKGKKKAKQNPQTTPAEDKVLITPVPRYHDKSDDSAEMTICLSKVYKAEKVELSEDRLTAGSTKGYRMVRATRGVCDGAWYFEIKVLSLGESGHTRLGWSTDKGDLQAPVGYDRNSFGYRDIDGSKVHKALREKYGEDGYKESDVIGFYINLPEGGIYAPKPPQLVWYKGQRYFYAPDPKEDPPKIIPGSEISFFKNGVCQGVAFRDLYGGRYYPAASMYTLPNQPNCAVKFNFGPGFEFFPEDFGGRPVPKPMIDVPYHGFDAHIENGVSNEKKQ